jgi:hypothetical protein
MSLVSKKHRITRMSYQVIGQWTIGQAGVIS